MSAASRQRSCAACGHEFGEGDPTDIEPMVDGVIRYVAVCRSCTTFPDKRARTANRAAGAARRAPGPVV